MTRLGSCVRIACVTIALLAVALPAVDAPVAALDDPTEVVDDVTGLALDAASTVSGATTSAVDVAALRPPAVRRIRVALVSSGVDVSVLPESLRTRVGLLGSAGDPVGYGTYVASVLLQLVPDAAITSIGVYPGGRFNPDWQKSALDWTVANAANLDVVLYAVPPAEFLDPVSMAMASGSWPAVSDLLSTLDLDSSRGPVFGLALDGALRRAQTQGLPWADYVAVERFAAQVGRWARTRQQVQALAAKGVAVVAPAGDTGPHPQTVEGVAALPDVVTVGGFDGNAISGSSSTGPSIDGSIKPDLAAPTGIVGLLPESSVLATSLRGRDLLDAQLAPQWEAGAPLTDARARLDSTMTAAALVAAAMGGLAAEGIRDVPRQRAALTAASVPVAGSGVTRQGAGVLRRVPDRAFATSRPLALSHADLGLVAADGETARTVPIMGGTATAATTSLHEFQGVGVDGRTAVGAPASEPPVSASVSNDGVRISLPAGDGSHRAGLYCGYTEVSVPATGTTVEPTVEVSGIPAGVEQVPTCFVQGDRLRAHGFYIHDTPAEDLTFALLPALPPGANVLEHPLMLLPVDPLATKLWFRVTGADGNAFFPNIPPGYYRVRQFSDYGAPVADGVAAPVDIGEPAAYQSFDALVVPGLCPEQPDGSEDECARTHLAAAFGAGNVERENSTWGWTVRPGGVAPAGFRVVLSKLKKMPGAGVSSRYVDLLRYEDLKWATVQAGSALRPADLAAAAGTAIDPAWSHAPSPVDPAAAATAFSPPLVESGGGVALSSGVAYYPFNLTTPNYKGHMSLNFSFDVVNAFVVAIVVVGESVGVGVVTPTGTVQLPSVGVNQPVNVGAYPVAARSTGRAGFDFKLLPKGASKGLLYLVFVPAYNTAVASTTISDLSFEFDTWTNTVWPAATLAPVLPLRPEPINGHSFNISSNYSTAQMSHPGCRSVDDIPVCEDWQVLVHSPGDDAATYDVVNTSSGASVMGALGAAGGGYFDPRRGVHDFSHVLSFAAPSTGVLEAELTVDNRFRTNGRFWEQLALTKDLLAAYPRALEMRIVDNEAGRASPLLAHSDGPARVGAYVPFTSSQVLLDARQLAG